MLGLSLILFTLVQMALASRSVYTFSIVSSVPQIIIPDAQVNRGINGKFEVHLNETPKVFDLEVRDNNQKLVKVVQLTPHSEKQSVAFNLGNQEIQIEYKFGCMAGFYGERCDIPCFPWKDDHFTCSEKGEKICEEGWTGENCTISNTSPAPVTSTATTSKAEELSTVYSERGNATTRKIEPIEVSVFGTSEPAEVALLDSSGVPLRIVVIILLLLLATLVLLLSLCFRRKTASPAPLLPTTVKSDKSCKKGKEKNSSRPESPRYTKLPGELLKGRTPEVNGNVPPHYVSKQHVEV